jgi:uncharacterized protein (DUF58 family)
MANAGDTALPDPEVVARLMRQVLRARQPMIGGVSGLHKSPHRGSSVEFAEYRKYAPGDDLRRLDWRVYGRTDRFYIREFEADTNLRCYLTLDGSASMGFGEPSKFEYARRLAATLAYLLVRQGDAVGFQNFGAGPAFEVPPRRNPSHLKLLLDTLAAVRPGGDTGLVAHLHRFAEAVKPRALVVVISDLFCDVEPLLGCLRHLRFRNHDLAVFHLLDRREMDFNFDRPMRFIDMERPESLLAEPAVVRRHYLEHFHEHLERLQTGCHEFKADYRRVRVDQHYESVLADFLVDRARHAGVR